MNRGTKNIYKAGTVVAVDGQRELNIWGKEGKCNEITGLNKKIVQSWFFLHFFSLVFSGGDTLVFVPYQTIGNFCTFNNLFFVPYLTK